MPSETEFPPLYVQTPNTYGVQNGSGQGVPAVTPDLRYRFSPEELRVMKECNRESFYYRCLPFAATGIIAVQYLVKSGVLKSHPRWGSTFKSIGAGFAGWVLGKVSYRKKCEEKLMHLPNSQLAELLKRKRGYISDQIPLDYQFGTSSEMRPSSQYIPSSSGTDYIPNAGSLNLDSDKNIQLKGLDDSQRPSLDNPALPDSTETEAKPAKSFVTYEELRRRNRDEYESRQSSLHHSPYQSPKPPPPQSSSWQYESQGVRGRSGHLREVPAQSSGSDKNTYGDVWDE